MSASRKAFSVVPGWDSFCQSVALSGLPDVQDVDLFLMCESNVKSHLRAAR